MNNTWTAIVVAEVLMACLGLAFAIYADSFWLNLSGLIVIL